MNEQIMKNQLQKEIEELIEEWKVFANDILDNYGGDIYGSRVAINSLELSIVKYLHTLRDKITKLNCKEANTVIKIFKEILTKYDAKKLYKETVINKFVTNDANNVLRDHIITKLIEEYTILYKNIKNNNSEDNANMNKKSEIRDNIIDIINNIIGAPLSIDKYIFNGGSLIELVVNHIDERCKKITKEVTEYIDNIINKTHEYDTDINDAISDSINIFCEKMDMSKEESDISDKKLKDLINKDIDKYMKISYIKSLINIRSYLTNLEKTAMDIIKLCTSTLTESLTFAYVHASNLEDFRTRVSAYSKEYSKDISSIMIKEVMKLELENRAEYVYKLLSQTKEIRRDLTDEYSGIVFKMIPSLNDKDKLTIYDYQVNYTVKYYIDQTLGNILYELNLLRITLIKNEERKEKTILKPGFLKLSAGKELNAVSIKNLNPCYIDTDQANRLFKKANIIYKGQIVACIYLIGDELVSVSNSDSDIEIIMSIAENINENINYEYLKQYISQNSDKETSIFIH